MSRRLISLLLAILTASALIATPALAAERSDREGAAVGARALELTDGPVAVKLHCESRVADSQGAVTCAWRGGDDAAISSWQLWNLQVRPERGSRNLVAELGADAHRYTDAEVSVPAAYLYAVLGLNGDGDVVARSRIAYVRLAERPDRIERLDLGCKALRGDGIADAATVRDDVVVGCEWRPAENRATAGYVLWRSVDGGERAVIARVGADVTGYRDHAVAPGHRYAYVVQSVDRGGHVIGMSRPAVVALRPRAETDRPADRETDVRPDVTDRETDVRPDVTDRETDVRPDATDRETDTAETDRHRPADPGRD